jgi:ABC-type multidrug transport system fused ATPase/permease subunit
MASLADFLAGKTIISITHNAKMAEQASCIFVMEDGKLAEFGSHSELLGKKGVYHRLFQSRSMPA